MTAAPVGSRRLALRANLHLVDFAILSLALTSLLLFLLNRAGDRLPQFEEQLVIAVDVTLAVLYAMMFVAKWAVAEEPRRWIRRNAIYALGAMPVTINLFVADRYFIVMQAVVVLLRIGEAMDRAFGERVMQGVLDRYRAMLIEELTSPILMRLAIVLEEAVTSRDYAAAVGRRLDERRDLVEAAVRRAIAASPKLSRLSSFGPVDRWIDETTREVVDAAHAALTGPEVNTVLRESMQEAFAELRRGIAQKKWQGKGRGVKDVATGFIHARE